MDAPTITCLIEHGADVEERVSDGYVPGATASIRLYAGMPNREKFLTIAESLLKLGTNVSVTDYEGRTALDHGIGRNLHTQLLPLLEGNVDINSVMADGDFPLRRASRMQGYDDTTVR